jgi:hypothetical protein
MIKNLFWKNDPVNIFTNISESYCLLGNIFIFNIDCKNYPQYIYKLIIYFKGILFLPGYVQDNNIKPALYLYNEKENKEAI